MQREDPLLRRQMLDFLAANPGLCAQHCVAVELDQAQGRSRTVLLVEGTGYQTLQITPDGALVHAPEAARASVRLEDSSTVAVRRLARRYVTIDGKPVGRPLDDMAAPLEGSPPPR
jgi:hypothetical protein